VARVQRKTPHTRRFKKGDLIIGFDGRGVGEKKVERLQLLRATDKDCACIAAKLHDEMGGELRISRSQVVAKYLGAKN
jgi:hypothetical protein